MRVWYILQAIRVLQKTRTPMFLSILECRKRCSMCGVAFVDCIRHIEAVARAKNPREGISGVEKIVK